MSRKAIDSTKVNNILDVLGLMINNLCTRDEPYETEGYARDVARRHLRIRGIRTQMIDNDIHLLHEDQPLYQEEVESALRAALLECGITDISLRASWIELKAEEADEEADEEDEDWRALDEWADDTVDEAAQAHRNKSTMDGARYLIIASTGDTVTLKRVHN